jgi:WD40 repeat protein
LWSVPDGASQRTLVQGDGTLWLSGPITVAWAPDSRTIAVGGTDGLLQIRKVADGAVVATLAGPADFITQLAYDARGHTLIAASWDGTVRVWRIP